MRMMKRTVAILILLCLLSLFVAACTKDQGTQETVEADTVDRKVSAREPAEEKADGEPSELAASLTDLFSGIRSEQAAPAADLFDRQLSVKVEHTWTETDSHYLLALFPDGHTGFYQSTTPGVMPELRDLNTGKVTKISLSEYRQEEVEFQFKTAIIMAAKRAPNAPDTSKLEEKLKDMHGLDIFQSYMNPLALRGTETCLTSAESDYLCLLDYNTGFGGMFDPKSGVVYNAFRDEMGSFTPVSAYGTKILGMIGGVGHAAILDVSDFSYEPFQMIDAVGYVAHDMYSCSSIAYLTDGSMAAVINDYKFEGSSITNDLWLGILGADGRKELYDLGVMDRLTDFAVVSNDPDYVIASPRQYMGAPARLVNRKTGEVTLLKIEGMGIASVPLDQADSVDRAAASIFFVDVLADGRTLIVRDGSTGALALFRPDTLEAKLIAIDEEVSYCTTFYGDHRGKLCTMCMPRGGQTQRGILLTIVDENGDPIF